MHNVQRSECHNEAVSKSALKRNSGENSLRTDDIFAMRPLKNRAYHLRHRLNNSSNPGDRANRRTDPACDGPDSLSIPSVTRTRPTYPPCHRPDPDFHTKTSGRQADPPVEHVHHATGQIQIFTQKLRAGRQPRPSNMSAMPPARFSHKNFKRPSKTSVQKFRPKRPSKNSVQSVRPKIRSKNSV
jgi:hypothetical protein